MFVEGYHVMDDVYEITIMYYIAFEVPEASTTTELTSSEMAETSTLAIGQSYSLHLQLKTIIGVSVGGTVILILIILITLLVIVIAVVLTGRRRRKRVRDSRTSSHVNSSIGLVGHYLEDEGIHKTIVKNSVDFNQILCIL